MTPITTLSDFILILSKTLHSKPGCKHISKHHLVKTPITTFPPTLFSFWREKNRYLQIQVAFCLYLYRVNKCVKQSHSYSLWTTAQFTRDKPSYLIKVSDIAMSEGENPAMYNRNCPTKSVCVIPRYNTYHAAIEFIMQNILLFFHNFHYYNGYIMIY